MPMDWKSSLQRTVTKSTTHAELLALSAASSELQWWLRLFEAIHLDLSERPTIYCDNLQTVQLVNKETAKLQTKLKHVDIHQCWIRQEVQAERVNVRWIETKKMAADGLTKPLSGQRHKIFMQQLGLVDIGHRLKPPESSTPPTHSPPEGASTAPAILSSQEARAFYL